VDVQQLLSVIVPIAVAALAALGVVVSGLLVVQRSIRAAELCPPDFPLARKLLPASATLIGLLAVRSFVAALQLDDPRLKLPLAIGALWTATYLLVRSTWILSKVISYRFNPAGQHNLLSRRVRTQVQFVEKIAYVGIIFLGVCSTLLLFEGARRMGESMLASAGVASVIIGFAAQKSLANLIAGFQIAFTQPIRLEDVVVVEGEWGWVEEITLTYVVIRIWDRRRLVLPITYFVEKPFQNWTRNSNQIIGAVTIQVSHLVPFAELEAHFFRMVEASPLWDREVRGIQMIDVAERTVTLRAVMTAKDSSQCWDLRCYIRRSLVEFLRSEYPEALPVVRVLDTGDGVQETRFKSGAALTAAGRS
jgi:small-conductance mechanosensitive channel